MAIFLSLSSICSRLLDLLSSEEVDVRRESMVLFFDLFFLNKSKKLTVHFAPLVILEKFCIDQHLEPQQIQLFYQNYF